VQPGGGEKLFFSFGEALEGREIYLFSPALELGFDGHRLPQEGGF
jgi:hypothetical protein